jgi:hypothetical protein
MNYNRLYLFVKAQLGAFLHLVPILAAFAPGFIRRRCMPQDHTNQL